MEPDTGDHESGSFVQWCWAATAGFRVAWLGLIKGWRLEYIACANDLAEIMWLNEVCHTSSDISAGPDCYKNQTPMK